MGNHTLEIFRMGAYIFFPLVLTFAYNTDYVYPRMIEYVTNSPDKGGAKEGSYLEEETEKFQASREQYWEELIQEAESKQKN